MNNRHELETTLINIIEYYDRINVELYALYISLAKSLKDSSIVLTEQQKEDLNQMEMILLEALYGA